MKITESDMTGWIDARTPPVREGVYESDVDCNNGWFRHWNGSWWGMFANTPESARLLGHTRTQYPPTHYRGLKHAAYRRISALKGIDPQ